MVGLCLLEENTDVQKRGGAKGAIITLVSYIDVCTDGKD